MLYHSLLIKAAFLLDELQNAGLSTCVVFVRAWVLFRADLNSLQVGRQNPEPTGKALVKSHLSLHHLHQYRPSIILPLL
jgi:hypothetical protein